MFTGVMFTGVMFTAVMFTALMFTALMFTVLTRYQFVVEPASLRATGNSFVTNSSRKRTKD